MADEKTTNDAKSRTKKLAVKQNCDDTRKTIFE